MKTACKTEGERTYFIVYELDPLAYEGAQHLAFMPYEDGLAKVYPSNTLHMDQFYQHFAQVGEEHACIEWIGEPVATSDENGVTEFGPLAASQLDTIDWRGYTLRVSPLTIQLAVNERRGLEKRVQEIRRALTLP